MELSVIIINFNTFDLTCQCIQSILDTTGSVKCEIILVDNASTERSASDFSDIFPSITLVINETNEGFARGNNIGIQKAKGDVILLLNSDALVKPGAIRNSLDFVAKSPKVAVVTCRLLYPDGKVQHNCQRFPSLKYSLFELLRLQKVLPKEKGGEILLGPFFSYNKVVYPDWVWGTFFMFRKSLLAGFRDNKLPDDFFMYGEDMQWCMEFKKKGYKIAYIPTGEVVHYMGKSKGNKDVLMKKNYDAFLKMYYPEWQIRAINGIKNLLEG
jgi:GT2 family glycosyltransferase